VLGGGGFESATVTIASGTSWTASSNVSWITFLNGPTFTGSATLYYQVAQNPSSTTGQQGTITVTSAGGSATLAVSEAAFASGGPTATLSNQLTGGALPSQQTQTLVITFGSPNGLGYLNVAGVIVANALGDPYSCQMMYYPQGGAFYFIDQGNYYSYTLGTPGQQATGTHCILNVAASSVTVTSNSSGAATGVTLTLNLTLQPSAVGTQNVYLEEWDLNGTGDNSYPAPVASWSYFAAQNVAPSVSMASAPGTGATQLVQYKIGDVNGYTYLAQVNEYLTNGNPGNNPSSPC